MENKTFVIIAGKWWDKVNGNTYYNSKIIDVSTGDRFYTGFTYGYGSCYYLEAINYLKEKFKDYNIKTIDGGSFYMTKREAKKGWF